MEEGLNEFNKQVNELNAADEKVKGNCEKTCKARYKALEDKFLYSEVYSGLKKLSYNS